MAMMMRKREQVVQVPAQEKILDVMASMQGDLHFKDPVNLHIQGTFEGRLQTKGQLTVGKTAQVKAEIEGDTITIAGKVNGKVIARELLKVTSTGECIGEVRTARLSVEEGGILHGHCEMAHEAPTPSTWKMTAEEAAQYLEIDAATIIQWAMEGKIPAIGEEGTWKFDKAALEQWVSQQKLNRVGGGA